MGNLRTRRSDQKALVRVMRDRPTPRRQPALLIMSTVFCLLSVVPAATPTPGAAQGTPGPADVPVAADCTVEARSPESLPTLTGTPAATIGEPGPVSPLRPPMPIPPGDPVDEATLAGITATIRELVACSNAGETDRQSGLYSDDFYRRASTGRGSLPGLAGAVPAAAGTPGGAPERAEPEAMPPIRDARRLADGRVGAIVDPGGMQIPADLFFVFVQRGERWLVDEIVLVDRKGS